VLERHLNEEPHTIVDVGCGNGGFIAYLARYGYENLYGVDLVMSRVEHVRHICELPAAIGSASKLPLPDLMPDLIVYSHLLEHVAEPRKALEQAAKRLPAGGLVYVEVADATRFAELPLSPLHWVGAAERVNLFDAHHLANLGRLAGLEPLETGQLTAPIAERVDIPVAYAVLRKGKGQALQPDEALKGGVAGYLKGQREALAGERDAVAELAAAGTPTIIWGVGHDLLCRFHESGLSRCKVVGLVDDASVRQDRKVGGIAVTGPKALSEATADHTIVLASPTRHAAMEARLEELGFAGKTLPLA